MLKNGCAGCRGLSPVILSQFMELEFMELRLSRLYPWHIMTSALRQDQQKYLINCHILLRYFELVFLQLQLVQILCKLIIIWVNYEKTKRVFTKHRVKQTASLLGYVWTYTTNGLLTTDIRCFFLHFKIFPIYPKVRIVVFSWKRY